MKNRCAQFLIILIAATVLSACTPTISPEEPSSNNGDTNTNVATTPGETKPGETTPVSGNSQTELEVPVVEYAATKSESVEALLNREAQVEFTDFGEAGKFVASINGIKGNDTHFWSFSINGKTSDVGVSQAMVIPGDSVTFTYEKIDTTKY